jgi:hypothetical protein
VTIGQRDSVPSVRAVCDEQENDMSNDPAVAVAHDSLVLGTLRVTFQRTLRVPESGLHDLLPGLGAFPIRRVEDYLDTDEPAALQVGIGKVCAISTPARL